MPNIDCPSCRLVDSVQKITAIVEGETHHTTGQSHASTFSNASGKQDFYAQENAWKKTKVGQGKISGNTYGSSFEDINTVQQSGLAQKFMAPDKPPPPTEPNFISWLSLLASGGLGAVIGIIVGLIAMVISFVVIIYLVIQIAEIGELALLIGIVIFFANFLISPLIGIAVGFIVGVIAIVAFGFLTNKRDYPELKRQKMQRDYELALKEYLEYQLPRWESAMQRWNSMFYCRRCDVVFIPGDEVYFSGSDNAINLAYYGI